MKYRRLTSWNVKVRELCFWQNLDHCLYMDVIWGRRVLFWIHWGFVAALYLGWWCLFLIQIISSVTVMKTHGSVQEFPNLMVFYCPNYAFSSIYLFIFINKTKFCSGIFLLKKRTSGRGGGSKDFGQTRTDGGGGVWKTAFWSDVLNGCPLNITI